MRENEHYSSSKPDAEKKDIEQLEILAFHFTQLSKRLAHDREHWAATGKDLAEVVTRLIKTEQQLAKLEQRLQEQVRTVIIDESRLAVSNISRAFIAATQQVLTQQLGVTAEQLSQVVKQASASLDDYEQELNRLKSWFVVLLIFIGLLSVSLTGIIVYYYLLLT